MYLTAVLSHVSLGFKLEAHWENSHVCVRVTRSDCPAPPADALQVEVLFQYDGLIIARSLSNVVSSIITAKEAVGGLNYDTLPAAY